MQRSILRAVTLIFLTVMCTRSSFAQIYESEGDRTFQVNFTYTADSSRITTIVYRDHSGPVYNVILKGDRVVNLCVDGQPVPADSYGRYQSVLDDIKVRIKEVEEQMKRDRAQAEVDRKQAEKDREQANRDREQAGRDREQAERDRAQAEKDRSQADQERQDRDMNRLQAERDREQADRDRVQAGRDREQAELDRQQAGRDREQAGRDREQAERDRVRAEEDRKLADSLISDLVADGIVPDRESIHSMEVNADEVRVNGKLLPEALQKKYIAKYVKRGFSMSFRND